MTTRFELMKEWSEGYCAALKPLGIDDSKGQHWQAGFLAGYAARKAKNADLDKYLIIIGQEPQLIIKMAEAKASQ